MQNYKNRQGVQVLREKLKRIDREIMNENAGRRPLREAINTSELKQINAALKMMQNFPKGIASIDNPIKEVIHNLNASVGTDGIQQQISWAMSMASMLKSGFENLQMILENNFEKEEFESDSTMTIMIGGQERLYDNVKRQLIMAFTGHKTSARKGWFKRLFFKYGAATKKRRLFRTEEEYDNPAWIDAEAVVAEIMNAPFSLLEKAIKVTKSAP